MMTAREKGTTRSEGQLPLEIVKHKPLSGLVSQFPPHQSLLHIELAIKATIGFIEEASRSSITMMTDWIQEKSTQLSHEILAQMASLKIHYEHHNAAVYNLKDEIKHLQPSWNT